MCLHSMTSMLHLRGTQADNVNNPVQPERTLRAVGGDKKQLSVGTEVPCLAAKTCWCMLLWESGKDYSSFVEADRQHFPFFHVIVTHKGSECSPIKCQVHTKHPPPGAHLGLLRNTLDVWVPTMSAIIYKKKYLNQHQSLTPWVVDLHLQLNIYTQ